MQGNISVGSKKQIDILQKIKHINYNCRNIVLTFTCLTYGIGTMNSPTSISPIDLERHKPPGQQRRGPICDD